MYFKGIPSFTLLSVYSLVLIEITSRVALTLLLGSAPLNWRSQWLSTKEPPYPRHISWNGGSLARTRAQRNLFKFVGKKTTLYYKSFFWVNVIDTCEYCNRFSLNIVFLSSLKCKFATWYLSNTGECNTTHMHLTIHSKQNHIEDKNALCSVSEDKELVLQFKTFGCFNFQWFWKVNFC